MGANQAEPDTFIALLLEADRDQLLNLGGRRSFSRGEHLMHQREPGDRVLLLLQGHVKATFVDPQGREMVLSFSGPGDVLGELSFARAEPRSSGVIAIEPAAAQALAASEFRSFLERTPSAALTLIDVLGRRLRDANRQRVQFGALDTFGRVAARLIELCERCGSWAGSGLSVGASLCSTRTRWRHARPDSAGVQRHSPILPNAQHWRLPASRIAWSSVAGPHSVVLAMRRRREKRMKTSMWTRLIITALAGCVVGAFAGPASGESGDLALRRDGSKAVPFVAQVDTESPAPVSSHGPDRSGGLELRRDGSRAVPFVADLRPEPGSSSDGFDWGDGAIGAGLGAGAVLLAMAGASAARSRRREVRARASEAPAG